MRTTNVDNILDIYNTLTSDEKISLFLELQSKDMREHYDPSYKRYRIQAKNVYGRLLVDRILGADVYNLREANRRAINLLENLGYTKYDESKIHYMEELEARNYQNRTYTEFTLIEKEYGV